MVYLRIVILFSSRKNLFYKNCKWLMVTFQKGDLMSYTKVFCLCLFTRSLFLLFLQKISKLVGILRTKRIRQDKKRKSIKFNDFMYTGLSKLMIHVLSFPLLIVRNLVK